MATLGRLATVVFASVAVVTLIGCGVAPAAVDEIGALDKWSGSASYGETGTVVTATYGDWPLPAAPDAFVCATPPATVFGPSPEHRLLVADDPACVRVQTSVDGRTLRTSFDRATLPTTFTEHDSWTVVLARATPLGHWSITKTMPADFPGPLPS